MMKKRYIVDVFVLLLLLVFILITSYSKLRRFQTLEDNLESYDEEFDMAMQIIENEVVDINNTTNNNSDINTLNDDYIETQLNTLKESERYVERQLKTALEGSGKIIRPKIYSIIYKVILK